MSYRIEYDAATGVLKVGFGKPAQNDEIVRDAEKLIQQLINDGTLSGGELIRVNGPASIPVAFVLAHALAHRYQAVAVYDPKLGKYVVSITHGGKYSLGDLID